MPKGQGCVQWGAPVKGRWLSGSTTSLIKPHRWQPLASWPASGPARSPGVPLGSASRPLPAMCSHAGMRLLASPAALLAPRPMRGGPGAVQPGQSPRVGPALLPHPLTCGLGLEQQVVALPQAASSQSL